MRGAQWALWQAAPGGEHAPERALRAEPLFQKGWLSAARSTGPAARPGNRRPGPDRAGLPPHEGARPDRTGAATADRRGGGVPRVEPAISTMWIPHCGVRYVYRNMGGRDRPNELDT